MIPHEGYYALYVDTELTEWSKDLGKVMELAECHAKDYFECDPEAGLDDMEDNVQVLKIVSVEKIELPFQRWFDECEEDIQEMQKEAHDKKYKEYLKLKKELGV